MTNKRNITYKIIGENETILAMGGMYVANDEWEDQNICDEAKVDFDDVFSIETTEV